MGLATLGCLTRDEIGPKAARWQMLALGHQYALAPSWSAAYLDCSGVTHSLRNTPQMFFFLGQWVQRKSRHFPIPSDSCQVVPSRPPPPPPIAIDPERGRPPSDILFSPRRNASPHHRPSVIFALLICLSLIFKSRSEIVRRRFLARALARLAARKSQTRSQKNQPGMRWWGGVGRDSMPTERQNAGSLLFGPWAVGDHEEPELHSPAANSLQPSLPG